MLFSFIISSILTLTVASKTEVTPSGNVPAHVAYSYVNTYKGGQLTAGNSATLTLTGLRDIQVRRITLMMHSNQSSGAGALSVRCGERLVWEIADAPFGDASWNGSFTNSDVAISQAFTPPLVAGTETLIIGVTASANSLYISSYTIEYDAAQARPYTVSFSVATGDGPQSLTEAKVGSGIRLPDVDYEEGGWRFAGWTTQPMITNPNCPLFLSAGEMYYPPYDATLYALYTDREPQGAIPPSRPHDGGVYVLVVPSVKYMATGGLVEDYWSLTVAGDMLQEQEDGLMLCTDRADEEWLYALTIEQDSLVYISSYKDASPIGYSDGKLKAQASIWTLRESAQGGYHLLSKEKETIRRLCLGLKDIAGMNYPTMALSEPDETKQGLFFYDVSALMATHLYGSYPPGYEQGWKALTGRESARKELRNGELLIRVGERVLDGLGRLR